MSDPHAITLVDWLQYIKNPKLPRPEPFIGYEFPTDELEEEFLARITTYSDEQVRQVLSSFLFSSSSFPQHDRQHVSSTLALVRAGRLDPGAALHRSQYDRRAIAYYLGQSKVPPWEGITWVLDLASHFPREAIEGLSAYILAHAQFLLDGRYRGLHEAMAIIRARFIGLPESAGARLAVLVDRSWRDLEHVVERLYAAMGYEAELTPRVKDGGRDVIAVKEKPGQREYLRIECKRHERNVGSPVLQALLGVA